MGDMTARLGLPLLQAGQAQKEVLHNEAIVRLEMLAGGLVEDVGRNDPPTSPVVGQAWIVGSSPDGDWADQAGAIAIWTEGGWRFVPPAEGLSVRLRDSGLSIDRRAAGWSDGDVVATAVRIGDRQVVGPRQPGIAQASGGTVIDGEARGVLAAILVALRSHGLIDV